MAVDSEAEEEKSGSQVNQPPKECPCDEKQPQVAVPLNESGCALSDNQDNLKVITVSGAIGRSREADASSDIATESPEKYPAGSRVQHKSQTRRLDISKPSGLKQSKVQFANIFGEDYHEEHRPTQSQAPPRRGSIGPRQQQPKQSQSHRQRQLSDASRLSTASCLSAASSYVSDSSLDQGDASSSSSSDNDDDSVSTYSFTAPDGGWGWVVVLAAFLVNMMADGVTFSFGVIFVELQGEFEEGKAKTAGVVSLFHAVPLLSGPIASALVDRYGCRPVTIVGSLLASLGFLLSAACHQLELLYVTFGLISGFGLSLCYVAAIVIVAFYFERRRSLATGISVCGSGVGTFLFAPLTQLLVDMYGWRGATVVLAGVFLNMIVCGMLFRDLEWAKRRRRKERRHRHLRDHAARRARRMRKLSGGFGSLGSLSSSSSCMPEIREIKALLENGDIRALFSQEELADCPRLTSSLVNIPTYIRNREKLPDEVIHALAKNKNVYMALLQNYPESLIFGGQNGGKNPTDDGCSSGHGTPERPDDETCVTVSTGTKLKRKVSSLFKKRQLPQQKSILKKTSDFEDDGPTRSSDRGTVGNANHDNNNHSGLTFTGDDVSKAPTTTTSASCKSSKSMSTNARNCGGGESNHKAAMSFHHLKIRRQSLTYRGAMLNISRYKLRASSCPDIYRNSMSTIVLEDLDNLDHEDGGRLSHLVSRWCSLLTYALAACCPSFVGRYRRDGTRQSILSAGLVLFCLSNFILYAWYDVMYVYLVDYAEMDLSITSTDATLLLSAVGLLNTVGEVAIGWAGDRSWVNLNLLYASCMLLCGAATAVVPFLGAHLGAEKIYSGLVVAAGVFGFAVSANYSLTSPILVDLVSLEQFSAAYGLLLLVQGISNLMGPPFAGFLYDTTGDWSYTFGLGGFFIGLSGVLLMTLPCCKQLHWFHDDEEGSVAGEEERSLTFAGGPKLGTDDVPNDVVVTSPLNRRRVTDSTTPV